MRRILSGRVALAARAALTAMVALAAIACSEPIAPSGRDVGASKVIVVDIESQKLYAWEGDSLVYDYHVVTGKCGKETTPGWYSVTRKYEDYTSMTYDVPMPYAMFFSEDGKAIHATNFATLRSFLYVAGLESIGSQGCVGLRSGNAERMFEWAPMGTAIQVVDTKPEEA
jgi:lipoprotein-anchoring transpeptidase ErfK/SrfK